MRAIPKTFISRPFAALSRRTQTFCFADDGKAKGATLSR
jgi:hypothetical protein